MSVINNVAQSVPDAVRQIFEGFLPYGSDFIMYCDSNNSSLVSYTCLFRKVGSRELSSVKVFRPSVGADWEVSSVSSSSLSLDSTVSKPYYCYSNIKGQGRYITSSSGQNLVVLMLVVCASIAVLRLVFGGVSLWREKSSPC